MKRLGLLLLTAVFLTACSVSVNKIKPKILDTIKSTLNKKTEIETEMVPKDELTITIDSKSHTVQKETMDDIRTLLEKNNEMQQIVVDLVGSQVTDENIAVLAYYMDKLGVTLEDLLHQLQ